MPRRSLERVDVEARAEFAVQLELAKQPMPDTEDLQRALDASYVRLFKEHGLGKMPSDVLKREAKLEQVGIKDVAAPFQQQYEARYTAHRASTKAARERLYELAPEIILKPIDESTSDWPVVHRVSKSTYSTQTQALHYAKVLAMLYCEGVVQRGVPSVVEEERNDYAVKSAVKGIDVDVVQYLPGLPMREWTKRCLQLGANPCVYMPYWTYGMWNKWGLDNFGNEVKGT